MYEIRVNGVSLDVFKGSSITLNGINPAVDKDRILREYTFPLRIPRSAQNDAAFSYQGRLDSKKKERKYTAQVFIAGVPYLTGVVRLKNANRTSYSIEFKSTHLDKWKQIEDAELAKNQPQEEIPQVYGSSIDLVVLGEDLLNVQDEYQCYMNIDGVNYNQEYPYDTYSKEAAAAEFSFYINHKYGSTIAFYSSSNDNSFSLDVSAFTKFKAYGSLRYKTGSDRFGELKHKNFQEYIKDKTTDAAQIPSITFPIMWILNKITLNPLVNNWRSDKGWSWNFSFPEELYFYSFMPAMRVKETLLRSLNDYGISVINIEGYINPDAIMEQLFLYSNRTVDEIITATVGSQDDPYYTRYINAGKQFIDYNNHVPQVKVQEMLFALAELLNGYIYIQGETLTIRSMKDIMLSEPIDWTHMTDQDYDIQFKEKDGLLVDYTRYTQEQKQNGGYPNSPVAGQLEPLEFGEAENEYILSFTTSYQDDIVGDSYAPTFRVSDEVGPDKTIDDIVFGWIPQQPISDPNTPGSFSCIPMVAHRNWASESDPPYNVFPFSLDLSDEVYSFWEVFYQGWDSRYSGDEIEFTVNLAVHDIIQILKWDKPLRWIHDEEGHTLAMIKDIRVKVTDSKLLPATVKLIKLDRRISNPV